uniref:Uncharacterized protein n=1 Tax=Rhizophora mucronata TaxID=61149 RepID=A0A2P2NU40_RHIMU
MPLRKQNRSYIRQNISPNKADNTLNSMKGGERRERL